MTQPNAINVMKIDENQLLDRLGKADWVIALPENLPSLTITTEWRRALQAYAGKEFVRWVIKGTDHVLTYDYDPSWDHSGSLQSIETDPRLLLARHEMLSDWAKDEYTGQSKATYTSGYGRLWTTYDGDIGDYIEREITAYLSAHCMNIWKIEDEYDLFMDKRWDFSDIPSIVLTLVTALLEDTLQLSTAYAWKWFEADISAENAAKRQQAEAYQHMYKQVRQFWERHFPDLIGLRIDMPLFREMGLEQRITKVLSDADPAIVRMMTEIKAVRFPGSYSNTVSERIQAIVKRATM